MNNSLYDIAIRHADKTETTLKAFSGQVLLIVNVASKCGLTPQYAGLEKLQEKYGPSGLQVLAFPANEFGAQEPGTDEQIQQFCALTYGVKFPVFSKLIVKGPGQHPLYAYLTNACPEPARKGSTVLKVIRKLVHSESFTGEAGEISWNFEKFLIDRQGEIVARFSPEVKPEDPWLIQVIEATLLSQPILPIQP